MIINNFKEEEMMGLYFVRLSNGTVGQVCQDKQVDNVGDEVTICYHDVKGIPREERGIVKEIL